MCCILFVCGVGIEGFGDVSAVTMCERLDIKSCKDTEKLKKAKDEVYLKGFTSGIMLVGDCKGMKVCDAKPIVRKQLIDRGDAIAYYEPESAVVSRTGDECIVALADQWYLSYSEDDWKQQILAHVRNKNVFNAYSDRLLEQFEFVINWLKEWACSRQFGLGTQLPWDEQWVIDSLSDSTIYMAYYTIAHHFHGVQGNYSFTGSDSAEISADQLNDEVFDYIFLGRPLATPQSIPLEFLNKLRAEFEYWYPMDLRVSAKDLIQNHLTMALYNHAEIWKDQPEMWPRGYYCNGHIMVDARKMSKSEGNFLMMKDSVEEFTADATRFALADAGDTLEDANFDRSVANNAILYLFVEEEWVRSVVEDIAQGVLREGPSAQYLFMDRAFATEMDYLVEATAQCYDGMLFRDAIHRAWFDMTIVRDVYRDWSVRCGIPMHRDILVRFIETLAVIMSPVIPHWAELVWAIMAPHRSDSTTASVCNARWPVHAPFDRNIRKQFNFFREFLKNSRQAILKAKSAKGGAKSSAYVFLACTYEPNKVLVLNFLRGLYESHGNQFPATLMGDMKTFIDKNDAIAAADKKNMMQFGAFMRDETNERGVDALAVELVFDQKSILEENASYISQSLEIANISFHNIEDESTNAIGDSKKKETAVPGKPALQFY